MSKQDKTNPDDVGTTGHSWDGIEEWNNALPRWWVWTFYATILWGIGYSVAYPAWPMISGATAGVLGYSTRGEVAAEIAAVDAANAGDVIVIAAHQRPPKQPEHHRAPSNAPHSLPHLVDG